MRILAGLCLVAGVVLAGCTTTPNVQMSAEAKSALDGKTFSVTHYQNVPKKIQTGGKTALFGAWADPYFMSEGERIGKQDDVADPADLVAAQISSGLTKMGMRKVGQDLKYGGEESAFGVKTDAAALLKAYPDGDYVLDADSAFWWMMYNLVDGYHVMYRGYNRILDRKTGEVVFAHSCGYDSNTDEADHPSYEELLANHSEKLKADLAAAARKCATEFMVQMAESGK